MASMGDVRILLIEDGSTYANLATILLRALGHTVAWASTAPEGLLAARAEPPDLILMDVHLPGMDGFEAVQQLKADPRTRGIPTLGMTADRVGSEADQARAREAGFDAYVEKPIDKTTFRLVIEPFLGSRAGRSKR